MIVCLFSLRSLIVVTSNMNRIRTRIKTRPRAYSLGLMIPFGMYAQEE